MTIRWRTVPVAPDVVRYGRSPDQLPYVAGSGRVGEDHVVVLTGLEPATQYFYSVRPPGGNGVANKPESFVTSPVPGAQVPVRIWVLGDPGTGWPVQRAVRDAYARLSAGRRTDLVLTLGDNAYSRGTDCQYQKAFFEVYRDIFKSAVLWPALGNHDAKSAKSGNETGVYYDIFTLPRAGEAGGAPSGTEAYYSFDFGNVHFICLNSEDSDVSRGGPMMTWLRADLARDEAAWTVAYWHHPPYSKGSHDSDDARDNDSRMTEMREKVVPTLEEGGVDLVLCGHSHLYERSYLLSGHYGKADSLRPTSIRNHGSGRSEEDGVYRKSKLDAAGRRGTVYINAGSSGHATKPKDLHGLNHPAMAVSLNVPGSVVLEIRGDRLDETFIDDRGAVRDGFRMSKARIP